MNQKENSMDSQRSNINRSESAIIAGRRRFTSRLWILIACAVLCLTPVAYGQFECLSKCQEQLANCLQTGHGDPIAASICQDNYDACCAACIGF